MIKVFTLDVYNFLHLGESLYFETPYVSKYFDVLSKKLCEPFYVSAPIGELILAKQVYRNCVISINHKDTIVYLVELCMTYFDVILGMDFLDV